MSTVKISADADIATTSGVVASCFGFVSIGALQALYGPCIPYFLEVFKISTFQAGLALSMHFVGALIGVMIFDRLHDRFTNRQLMVASYATMALGCLLIALSPLWSMLVFGAFVVGLGFGGIDFGLNYFFSIGFGARSASKVNLLNAHFGVGAVLGPMMVAWVGPDQFRLLFLVFGIASLMPLLAIRSISNSVAAANPLQSRSAASRHSAILLLGAFFVIYIFHVAIETGVGGWATTHLTEVGYTVSFAAATTSAYWLALTLGRFAAAWLTLKLSPAQIMLGSCAGMAASLIAASHPAVAPGAYLLVGLFIAPIFPTGLAWLSAVHPASRNATASVIATSMIGGVAFPPIIGAIMSSAGPSAGTLFMALLAVACVVSAFVIVRTTELRPQ